MFVVLFCKGRFVRVGRQVRKAGEFCELAVMREREQEGKSRGRRGAEIAESRAGWYTMEGGEGARGSRPRGGQEGATDKTLSLSYFSACRLSFWASTPTRSPYL